MEIREQVINGPCGANCCRTKKQLVLVKDDESIIPLNTKYEKLFDDSGLGDDLPWAQYDDRRDAFVEHRIALTRKAINKLNARKHVAAGASVLHNILHDNAFDMLAVEQEQVIQHEIIMRKA